MANPKKNAVLSQVYWIQLVWFTDRKQVINKLLGRVDTILYSVVHSFLINLKSLSFERNVLSTLRKAITAHPLGKICFNFFHDLYFLLVHKDSYCSCYTLNIPSVIDYNVANKRIMTSFSSLPASSEQEGEMDYMEKRPCLKTLIFGN